MALLGYARVSTTAQDPAGQVQQLTAAGCEAVYVESESGYKDDRPKLAELLAYARKGDVIVIWKLDRLARSLPHLLKLSAEFKERGIELRSLSDQIDTTSASGRFMFAMLGAVAQFEGDLRRERQELAWASGKQKGRPKSMTVAQGDLVVRLRGEGKSLAEIANAVGISKAAAFRHLAAEENAKTAVIEEDLNLAELEQEASA